VTDLRGRLRYQHPVSGSLSPLRGAELGLDEVPCIVLAHLTSTQRRAYVLADNKLALNAGWDLEMLSFEKSDQFIAAPALPRSSRDYGAPLGNCGGSWRRQAAEPARWAGPCRDRAV
jgi:hypothetical protein